MAAPGIGAGDILTACKFVYDICVKYKDAPEQFDEIAEKAKATRDVIERLDLEAKTGGSLVHRAGETAAEQFQTHLDGLRGDLATLQKLVDKYSKIHDEGPGRRLLWAVWESSNLTEHRRKIAYHEAKLNIWYTSLVYGSLRRIETGQEHLLEALRDLTAGQEKAIRDGLKKYGDARPLYRVLEQKGVPKQSIDANLPLATTYVTADPDTQCKMTDHVRQRSHESRMSGMHSAFDTYTPPSGPYRYDGGRGEGSKPGSKPDYPSKPDWPSKTDYPSKPGYPPGKGGKGEVPGFRQYTAGSGEIPYFPPYESGKNATPGTFYFSNNNIEITAPDAGPGQGPSRQRTKTYTHDIKRSPTLDKQREEKLHAEPREKELQPGLHRSKSSRKPKEPKPEFAEMGNGFQYMSLRPDGQQIVRSPRTDTMGGVGVDDAFRPVHVRRKSDTPLPRRAKSPLIVIDDDGPAVRIQPTTHRRTRSSSAARRDRGDEYEYEYEVPVIVVEEEGPRRSRSRGSGTGSGSVNGDAGRNGSRQRDESTSSYRRERPRSSSGGSERGVRQYRVVRKMDRIDSLPVDEDKK